MTYEEARRAHHKQYFEGKNKGKTSLDYEFPFGIRYRDEKFVTVKIPLSILSISKTDAGRVATYVSIIKERIDMGPVWISVGKKLKDGTVSPNWDNKVRIKDGNHRTAAHKKLGIFEIEAILPESHYKFWRSSWPA